MALMGLCAPCIPAAQCCNVTVILDHTTTLDFLKIGRSPSNNWGCKKTGTVVLLSEACTITHLVLNEFVAHSFVTAAKPGSTKVIKLDVNLAGGTTPQN